MLIKEALAEATLKLRKSSADSAALDAEILLAHVLKKSKTYLFTRPEKKLAPSQLKKYNALINRRAKHEPTAYITGHKEFFGLDFFVNKHVLIPRPASELLVEEAIKIASVHPYTLYPKRYTLIDLGTGSGCLAISLAKHLPHAKIIAIDNSTRALAVARTNAQRHNVQKQITFTQGNILTPIKSRTDAACRVSTIIIANLPYLSAAQYRNLPPDIKNYEPKSALVAGRDGLKYYRQLFQQFKKSQLSIVNCQLLLEIDPSQTQPIKKIIKRHLPSAQIQIKKDLAGLNRVVIIKFVQTRHAASLP